MTFAMSLGILTCKKRPSLASDMDGFQYVFPVLALLREGTKEDNKNKRIIVFKSAIKYSSYWYDYILNFNNFTKI